MDPIARLSGILQDYFVRKSKPNLLASNYCNYSSFGNSNSCASQSRNVYNLNIVDVGGNNHSLPAAEVNAICPPLRRQKISKEIM